MKTFARLVGATAAAGLLALGMSVPAQAQFDNDAVERAVVWVDTTWRGVVTVPFEDDTTKNYETTATAYCTGWIVSEEGHVATAGHCVRFDDGLSRAMITNVIQDQFPSEANRLDVTKLDWRVVHEPTPTIRIGQPSVIKNAVFTNDGMTAQLLDSQDPEAGDNAVVQVAGKSTKGNALSVASTTPKVRDKITSVGFPSDTGSITEPDRQSPTFKEGTISAQIVSKKGVPMLQLDGELISGMSGGPTLDDAGNVVGINSSSFTNRDQSYVTTTDTMRTFLAKNGVTLATASVPAPTAASTGVAGGAPLPAQTVPASDNSGLVVWIVVLAALLVLALAVGAFFVLRRRNQPVATQAAPPSPSA